MCIEIKVWDSYMCRQMCICECVDESVNVCIDIRTEKDTKLFQFNNRKYRQLMICCLTLFLQMCEYLLCVYEEVLLDVSNENIYIVCIQLFFTSFPLCIKFAIINNVCITRLINPSNYYPLYVSLWNFHTFNAFPS